MKKPAVLLALTASLLAPLATPALAAPKISAQSIIVNPVPTTLAAQVWVDRDPSGTRTPNYRIGDRIRLSVSVNENAYVYLFNVNPDGSVDQILPNRLSGSNYVRRGEIRTFPASGDNFVFNVGGPAGLNKVLVVASRRQLDLSELSTFQAGQPFASVKPQGSQQLAQALSIVVNPVDQPIPQQDWVSDTAFFNVTY
ncbi:DUF4384 domain-containing protein [Deinococcus metallilatus]|uniref:DUF4384 domain-containing protein n=2 Tax=Deinococcus TaxID=1298 RepID=A0AAJ5F0N9_9DEIO|nr:DUF4384 domain-containing protein [Deinococcus metallilatus]MBB5296984.1 hypothetical protein [Deinococcus metallilatus]QBY07878.1 DUF4384 domain-containing protein [Deinococcus metallilatus]RXJ13227.1 DUF4384 domain-containing protein [Deinococcus metallilatus]TLK23000.1 DUF4384 domain-containing protein [Deinococcus metallilatus]GMA15950.1 hypothetical protein GCM10025871_22810 [Deinococcus metallilatus]